MGSTHLIEHRANSCLYTHSVLYPTPQVNFDLD